MEEKIKTRSSSAKATNQYMKKNYCRLGIDLSKDKAEKFKQKCAENGVTHTEVARRAILKYLGEDE